MHDAIVGVEGTEEGDFQESWCVGELAFAFRGFPFAVFLALVDD